MSDGWARGTRRVRGRETKTTRCGALREGGERVRVDVRSSTPNKGVRVRLNGGGSSEDTIDSPGVQRDSEDRKGQREVVPGTGSRPLIAGTAVSGASWPRGEGRPWAGRRLPRLPRSTYLRASYVLRPRSPTRKARVGSPGG